MWYHRPKAIKNLVSFYKTNIVYKFAQRSTMAQYNFEGDMDKISRQQLEFIKKVILEHGFENNKVIFAPVGIVGDNYTALVKRITVEGKNDNLLMISKLAPASKIFRELTHASPSFNNEHIMYLNVLPKLVKLQKDAGVPEKEQLKYATCYGSLAEEPNEVILLEDLKTRGYIMLDRFVSLNDGCIKSVLKNFALLHSLSYVLKQKQPNVFDEIKSNLVNMYETMGEFKQRRMFMQSLEEDTLTILQVPEHIKLLKDKISSFSDTAANITKIDSNNRYAVILQGDASTSNIMFRFENDAVAESIMVNYQLSRIGSPVTDIMFLIFNCTDHEMRMKHYHDWIDYYHSELEKSLSNFNLKASYVYPRDKLDADLKRYGNFILVDTVVRSSLLIRKSDDFAKVMEAIDTVTAETMLEHTAKNRLSNLDEETVNQFRKGITGLIESFTEFGIL